MRPQFSRPPRRPAERKPLPPAIDPATIPPPRAAAAVIAGWGDRAGEIASKLSQYISLLLQANEVVNLTGDAAPEKQWSSHVEDALLNAQMIESALGRPAEGSMIIDLGSGGGLPGIVWAILWPQARVKLIEATRKKAEFLARAIAELGLANAEAIPERSEDVGHREGFRETCDLVTARAFAPLPVLAELALPFVKIGGQVWAIKGADVKEELASAERALKLLGAPNPPEQFPYSRSDRRSCVALSFRKSAKSPAIYPRRPGVAETKPL